MDQRSGKADSGGTFSFLRAGDGIASPVLSDGAATYNYGAGLVSEVRSGTSKFYQSDALGSTRELTNSSGSVTDAHETDAFGNTVAASGSTPTPFGFAGQAGYQTDSDTGLKLLGHRYYDSSTGRFLSRDPIRDGDNWYAYCANNPVDNLDPSGLSFADKAIAFLIMALSLSAPTDNQAMTPTTPPRSPGINGVPGPGLDDETPKGPGKPSGGTGPVPPPGPPGAGGPTGTGVSPGGFPSLPPGAGLGGVGTLGVAGTVAGGMAAVPSGVNSFYGRRRQIEDAMADIDDV